MVMQFHLEGNPQSGGGPEAHAIRGAYIGKPRSEEVNESHETP